MTVAGAVYRPLRDEDHQVELAVAWRGDETTPLVARALHIVRRELTTV